MIDGITTLPPSFFHQRRVPVAWQSQSDMMFVNKRGAP
jgi:hypothetical protein